MFVALKWYKYIRVKDRKTFCGRPEETEKEMKEYRGGKILTLLVKGFEDEKNSAC